LSSHSHETAAEAAATTSNHSEDDATTAAADDDDDNNDNEAIDDDDDDEDIMGPKTIVKTPSKKTTTAVAKKDAPGVDAITSGIQGVTLTKGVKKPAFTPYSTKVTDILLFRSVFIDGEQFVEFDLSLAAALLCGDGIKAVLAPDGMRISLQRGVFASFFTNKRYRKDLGDAYNKDSSSVNAHRKVCDKFKKKESARNGIVYGECQFVQLPTQCTGLVEQTYIGRVVTPITIPFSVTHVENGMEVEEEQDHIQFMVNTTFRVKMAEQIEKEKKVAKEVTHNDYDIFSAYDSG
jgi:hypothetical protein